MNYIIKWTGLFMLSLIFSLNACKDVEEPEPMPATSDMTLNITGLEDLGADAVYEGWIMVDGSPVSTGTFQVDGSGNISPGTFKVLSSDLMAATAFVLTIEPSNDTDPAPSSVKLLAGDFSGNSANLSVSHMAALNNDFSLIAGKYLLATPTDTSGSNEESGVWFVDNSSGSPMAGLMLPALPAGWMYEGWAVINHVPVSTGTITSADMADNSAPFSGSETGPPFPGEDFLQSAPSSLSFPTDLRGGMVVISIEPVPDNSPLPFALKPLVASIPGMTAVHTVLDMDKNLNFPMGTATR